MGFPFAWQLIFLLAALLMVCSISTFAQVPIEIDTDGQVYATYQSAAGPLYYVQEAENIIYKNPDKKAWLKIFDGAKSYRLHPIDLFPKANNSITITASSDSTLIIASDIKIYNYNTSKNIISEFKSTNGEKIIKSFHDHNIFYYVTENESTFTLFKFHDTIHSKIITHPGYIEEILQGKEKLFYFILTPKSSTEQSHKNKIIVSDYNGLIAKDTILSITRVLHHGINFDGNLIQIVKEDESKILHLKTDRINSIRWDGNLDFDFVPIPPIKFETQYITDKNGQEAKLENISKNENHLHIGSRVFKVLGLTNIKSIASNNLQKNIWIGCKEGLFRLNLDEIQIQQELLGESLRSIQVYDDHLMMAINQRGEIFLLNRKIDQNGTANVERLPQHSSDNRFLHINKSKRIYSNFSNDLVEIQLEKRKKILVEDLDFSVMSALSDSSIIHISSKNAISLLNLHSLKLKKYPIAKDITNVVSCDVLLEKYICYLSSNGVHIFDLESENYVFESSYPSNTLSIYCAQDSMIYTSFENGLVRRIRLENGVFIDEDYVKLGAAVATFNQSSEGDLWLGCFNGIAVVNHLSQEINYINKSLISNPECNRFSSYFDEPNNKMYIGTINGLNIIDLNTVNNEHFEGKLMFSEVHYPTQDSQRVDKFFFENKLSITLPANKRNCKIAYVAYDKFLSSKFTYKYRLNKNEWIDVADKSEINFTFFKKGKNTLEIQAFDKEKLTPTNVIIGSIYATPFFYETSLFRVSIIAFLFLSAFYWYKRTKNENVRLEKIVNTRTQELKAERKVIEHQAKELEELDKIKNQFFANISHELRTPLTLLISPLESLANNNALSEKDLSFLEIMKNNGNLLKERIDELLELSKLSSTNIKLDRNKVNLKELIDLSTSIFKQKADEKNIDLIIKQENTTQEIICDEKRVSKIIQNLLSNAIKFTPKSGEIICSFIFEEKKLIFTIKDNGVGIIEKDQSKIFQRFYQVQVQDNKANPGTGIGLAMVEEYISLMNGDISIDSKLGEGSTFNVQLPMELALQNQVKEEIFASKYPHITITPPIGKEKPKILIVEDNIDLQQYTSSLLAPYFFIELAGNGIEALNILKTNSQVDIILSDIMMPEMDGITLLKKVREDKILSIKPFVFLSAIHNQENIMSTFRIGVDDYLTKPFSEKELLYRIHAIYKNYSRRVEANLEKASDEEEIVEVVSGDEFRNQLKNVILGNITSVQFSTEFLASYFQMSRRHFVRTVKKEIGMTPIEFITEVRLNFARELYESKQITDPEEITSKIGLSTTKYFRKLYLARFGVNIQ